MKFSSGAIKTLKKSKEASANADLLTRAGYINQHLAGIYTLLPLGKIVTDKISEIVKAEMDRVSGAEVLMPALQSAENWKKTGRWEKLDVLFRFKSYYTKTDYALGPTHEEVVTPLAKNYIQSYKDLPLYLYQIQTKFRDEKRAKSGLLRNREFLMKDLYSFHANMEDLDNYYEVVTKAYKNIFKQVGIDEKTYITYASGGSFSKYSHEFQAITDSGEDTIYLCKKCNVAVNKEIIEVQKFCPECKSKNLSEEKSIEVGNIFKLGTKFSQAFNLVYKNQNDKEELVVMGCYGIGIGRLMGAVVEISHDEAGIIWPKPISPFKYHLISLEGAQKEAEHIYKELVRHNIEVLWDDRNETAGVKLADADLIGIANRILVSRKTIKAGKIELKERTKRKEKLVKLTDILKG